MKTLLGCVTHCRRGHGLGCIEVFPNAIVQARERGVAHKSSAAGLQRQVELVSEATGCADVTATTVAFGLLHERLDALMAVWVASLPADRLEAHGDGQRDTIRVSSHVPRYT